MESSKESMQAYWHNRIEMDLTPYMDPGTTLNISAPGRTISASWTRNDRVEEATFSISLVSGVLVTYKGTQLDYRAFFASTDMSDLMRLAKMTFQARQQQIYVETLAISLEHGETQSAATNVLNSLLSGGAEPEATRVIMVTGEAGAGKTRVLQQLVRMRADEYIHGQSKCLLMYVNAQGRALARFTEALATELQDLKVSLTYHAVSTLVRLGLLVPVIDGFDELLGTTGYDDAFSSLASFIEELDGQGQVVASARSTYYEQEFVSRANRVSGIGSLIWQQLPVQVLEWGSEQFDDYFRQRCQAAKCDEESTQVLSGKLSQVFKGANESLKSKPFFVSRTLDLLLEGREILGGENLLEDLVTAFIERERTEKLLTRTGGYLLSSEQMKTLFATLAEEMWNQETRELNARSLKEVAEYVLMTEGAEESAQAIVLTRLPSMAFLVAGQRSGSVTFEHETFFSYFLAQSFLRLLSDGKSPLSLPLGRSMLPEGVVAIAAGGLTKTAAAMVPTQTLLDRFGNAAELTSPRLVQIRENAGLLAQALLKARHRTSSFTGLRLWNLVIPGGDLHDITLYESMLDKVELRRVDLSKCRFMNCSVGDVLLYEVLVNPSFTRLELKGLDPSNHVLGLRRTDRDSGRGIFDPKELQETLEATGAAKASENEDDVFRSVNKDVEGVLARFVRAYGRSNPICTANDNMLNVFRHKDWDKVQRLLVSSGVVTEETRDTGGSGKTFLRRQVLPEQIMAGARKDARVPRQVRQFWDLMESEFPD